MIGLIHVTATPPGTFAGNVDWFTNKHPDYAPHDLVDPSTGQEQQFVAYNQPSKALLNAPGGVETNNRPGGVYQVEIVADEYCGGYSDIWYARLNWWLTTKALALNIPYSIYPGIDRFSFEQWMNPNLVGFYRHINVPENDHRCSWLLDLTRLAQPLPPKEQTMPEYIIRYQPDLDHQPWLAVYPSGKLRWIGGNEAGYLVGKKIPFVDEVSLDAYTQAKKDAGV